MVNEAVFYNQIYKDNPRKWANDFRNMLALSFLSAHTTEPETFLDIGCGNGHTIEYFSKRWINTKYYGVDLSDVAIGLARQRVPDASFFCQAYEDGDLPYCDVVTIMGVLEHFENIDDALQRLKMSSDLIYVECPNCLAAAHSQIEGFRETKAGSGQSEWHLFRSTWEKHINDAGLEILENHQGLFTTTEFVWVLK